MATLAPPLPLRPVLAMRPAFAALTASALATGCTQVRDERDVWAAASGDGGASEAGDGHGGPGSGNAGDEGSDDGGSGPPKLDVGAGDNPGGGDEGGECPPSPPGAATLTGTVYAPNGTLPISGAAIWLQSEPPEGVPDEVFCLECVAIPCDEPHAFSQPDGSFVLDAPAGSYWLVVRKGQFMRATAIEVEAGATALAQPLTTLPSQRDPAHGEWIPNIALAWGEYDALQDALAKLGLGELDAQGRTLQPGSQRFDVWDNHSPYNTPQQNPLTTPAMGTLTELVEDAEALSRYHIVFVPCSGGSEDLSPTAIENIRAWVAAGGRWYVADWSLAWLDQPFGQYQSFWQDGFTGGPYLDAFDSIGTVRDDDLAAWLGALPPAYHDINPANGGGNAHPTLDGLPHIDLRDLWSTIATTPAVLVDDGNGGQIDVGHKVWIDGPGGGEDGAPADSSWPLSVTAEYGCGKIMFTSYHTTEWETYAGLTPQELVLAYLILEIGTCQVPHPPPPPAG
jgi:hypothetical protein